MELVFWQNILSPHQAPFIRALADQGHQITVVTDESMSADRVALGWKVPDHGRAKITIAPKDSAVQRLIENSPKDAIHVIAGARWKPLGNLVERQCLAAHRRVGIITEAPDPRGFAGYGRWVKYTKERFTTGSRFDFILAMGEMGTRWFRRCGYPAQKLFPFAYVTEPVPLVEAKNAGEKSGFLYVGQFIVRKGLDILLQAFAASSSSQIELRMLGEGPEQPKLQRMAHELGIENRVIWLAKSDAAGVQGEMAKANVSILPSRHDGWGAVVNESLMVGTPVICSTACGAAELISQPWLGTVFRSDNADNLAKALKTWIDLGPRSQDERERIRGWSNCISGPAVASYMASTFDHVYGNSARPMAPWRK
jgi:glycosyltransferase involved in cell wall biosynthesis